MGKHGKRKTRVEKKNGIVKERKINFLLKVEEIGNM